MMNIKALAVKLNQCAISHMKCNTKRQSPWPNIAVKQTSTRLMASPFSWTLSAPSTRYGPFGSAYLGRWASERKST